jgi:hypothetical protein
MVNYNLWKPTLLTKKMYILVNYITYQSQHYLYLLDGMLPEIFRLAELTVQESLYTYLQGTCTY